MKRHRISLADFHSKDEQATPVNGYVIGFFVRKSRMEMIREDVKNQSHQRYDPIPVVGLSNGLMDASNAYVHL